jgi:hypothetical protein
MLLLPLMMVVPDRAMALDCDARTVCETVGATGMIFTATVSSVRSEYGILRYSTARVNHVYKGKPGEEVVLFQDGMWGGPAFAVGQEYLFYGQGMASGQVYISGCSRSMPLEEAKSEDLPFLERYSRGKARTGISGTVRVDDDDAPVRGVRIVVTGSAAVSGIRHTYFLKTDANGRYSLPDIPAGNYMIAAKRNGFKTLQQDDGAQIHVDPGGCAVQNVRMETKDSTLAQRPNAVIIEVTQASPMAASQSIFPFQQ